MDVIEQLLAGTYRDPDDGTAVRIGTRSLVIEPSLGGAEPELLAALGLDGTLAVVSDVNTYPAMGQRIERSLSGRYKIISVVLPDGVHPDDLTVEKVRTATMRADALVAVGSGTINDLCKFSSARDGKPYVVFATAPSMNGYTSFNAAITVHGHKMSLPAQVPLGAFFDIGVLAAAPPRLIRAGLGDSLCRGTAQADWLLAHLLWGQAYRTLPFDLLKDDEGPLFDQAGALMRGDKDAVGRLVRVLVLAGLGTAIVGHSQPASQGEHLISHYIDMFAPSSRPLIYHGEQVAVTTLSMARLQEAMLADVPAVAADTDTEADFRTRYGDEIGVSCWKEFSQKRLDADKADALRHDISIKWNDISEQVGRVMIPSARLHKIMAATGAGLTPEAIHLGRPFYEQALVHCREIRNRYTFLDLAASSGALPRLVGEI